MILIPFARNSVNAFLKEKDCFVIDLHVKPCPFLPDIHKRKKYNEIKVSERREES